LVIYFTPKRSESKTANKFPERKMLFSKTNNRSFGEIFALWH
jgi:hypothetical protein